MRLSFPEHHLFQILKRHQNQPLPLDFFLSQYFRDHKSLGSKDRKWVAEHIFGMTRWRLLLDYLIGKDVCSWEERFATYKNFDPKSYLQISSIPLHLRVSFPKELFDLLLLQYGEEKAVELCLVSNTQAPTTIRVNSLKTTRECLLQKWKDCYEMTPCVYSEWGIQFKKREPLFHLSEFKEGLFEVQDEGSQLVGKLVKALPGQKVLDYCAGSGGKTLTFAPWMQHSGQIFLHDIRHKALLEAKIRLRRAGIQNAQTLPPGHLSLEKIKKKMDWVLVDAPCSGTGTFRRNPEMKSKFTLEMLKKLQNEQRIIFERALSYVRPAGHIVYATCSILKDENENQVEHFLKHYPLELIEKPFFSLPIQEGMDGFFGAVFKKLEKVDIVESVQNCSV